MANDKAQKIIVIVGPTASGKSDLAIKIAKKFNVEIISADSRQVYRGMDIGTGKVSKRERGVIPHHLIDIASPKRTFTVAQFKKLGQKAIKEVLAKNKIPIIVGGTGFYIDVLLDRILIAEVPPNKKLRARFDKLTVEHLFKMLQKLDPRRARTIEPKNKRRLIRALEIILTTGKPVLSPKVGDGLLLENFKILWLGLNPGKEKLAERIKKRLDARLKQGMIKEVINLHKQGLSWKRLNDLGLEYRQISRYLTNKKFKVKSEKNFKNSGYYKKLLRDIIKYSKRQMTWFKKNKEIRWKETGYIKSVKGFLN